MDQIIAIFNKLGVDQAVFYQLIVFAFIYLILRNLFFSKLKFVVLTRETKTTKLDDEANKKLQEANQLQEQYKKELNSVHAEIFSKSKDQKESLLSTQKGLLKQEEQKANSMLESEVATFARELDQKKSQILQTSDQLSKELLERLV